MLTTTIKPKDDVFIVAACDTGAILERLSNFRNVCEGCLRWLILLFIVIFIIDFDLHNVDIDGLLGCLLPFLVEQCLL